MIFSSNKANRARRKITALKSPTFPQAAMIHPSTVVYLHADMNTAMLRFILGAQSNVPEDLQSM